MSQTLTSIQNRQAPSDVFYTPEEVVEMAIDAVKKELVDTSPDHQYWYDPFKGVGAYYNKFPDGVNKDWAEIELGRDFYSYIPEGDGWEDPEDITKRMVVCSNPPYSHLNGVIDRLITLKPDIIQLTIGPLNLTKNRWRALERAGYTITNLIICDVKGWFGHTHIFTFNRNPEPIYKRNPDGTFVEVPQQIQFNLNPAVGTGSYHYSP